MSFERRVSLPSKAQQQAWKNHTWQYLKQHITQYDQAFATKAEQYGRKLTKTTFTTQAINSLCCLNEFDRLMVLKDCVRLEKNPNDPNSYRNRLRPAMRWVKSGYCHGLYHYKIRYLLLPDQKVVIDDMVLDDDMLGPKNPAKHERTAMYLVTRKDKSKRITQDIHYDDIKSLEDAWDIKDIKPVSEVITRYAAINGMKNNLEKAMWLMGTHLDWAYRGQDFDSYTLVHNPTESTLHDLWECGWDKQNKASLNANHLSAILVQVARQGLPVNWVAHSQGGIILQQALKVIKNRTQTIRLTNQQMALHSIGCQVQEVERLARELGLKVSGHNANPFDIVPNMAGGNDWSAWRRSLMFSYSVFFADEAVSPHTLPFMGINTYHRHLMEAGKDKRARWVERYMRQQKIKV
ncbi:hypothetical protein [Aliikangiella sp. IMCC44359]|uniref:hypothetical protein n=1 Tax=Aliikangiella sp. IMCC44359 TaxID=3459125 RepID=UPI00403B26D5